MLTVAYALVLMMMMGTVTTNAPPVVSNSVPQIFKNSFTKMKADKTVVTSSGVVIFQLG